MSYIKYNFIYLQSYQKQFQHLNVLITILLMNSQLEMDHLNIFYKNSFLENNSKLKLPLQYQIMVYQLDQSFIKDLLLGNQHISLIFKNF